MEGVYCVLYCYGPLSSDFDPGLEHEPCFGQEDINQYDTNRGFKSVFTLELGMQLP